MWYSNRSTSLVLVLTIIYKVEVKLNRGLSMLPLEHCLNQIYSNREKAKILISYYKTYGFDHIHIFKAASWEKYSRSDGDDIDISEYLYDQYCIFDPMDIHILEKLQPKTSEELLNWVIGVQESRIREFK